MLQFIAYKMAHNSTLYSFAKGNNLGRIISLIVFTKNPFAMNCGRVVANLRERYILYLPCIVRYAASYFYIFLTNTYCRLKPIACF